jgi:hypothetical protein
MIKDFKIGKQQCVCVCVWGGVRGWKIDLGIRNFNLRRNRVRNRGKIGLNQSLIYIHPFAATLTPIFCLPYFNLVVKCGTCGRSFRSEYEVVQ